MAHSLKKIFRSMFIPNKSKNPKHLLEFDVPFDLNNMKCSKVKFSELYYKFYGMKPSTTKN